MKTFGELTREEKIELFTAWIDGAEIEFLNPSFGNWYESEDHGCPIFYDGCIYRIKPTKPSINWDHVHADYNWLAVDSDNMGALYVEEPNLDSDQWYGREWRDADAFSSFKPGTCDWKDSLVERPKK